MSIGKFIGGAIGWVAGGPIGGLMGMILGGMFDSLTLGDEAQRNQERQAEFRPVYPRQRRTRTTSRDDFNVSLLILSAAVMKADGKPLKSELEFVKKFLTSQFGRAQATEYIRLMREILKKDFSLREVCIQIQQNMQHSLRLQLMHYLFGIANANNHIADSEMEVIHRIANYLRISSRDYASIKSMFVKSGSSAYKILGITKAATDDEVKKAYRKMARKYHPDKVMHLGKEHQLAATEKFKKIQEAYETIKKKRRMK